MLSKKSPDFFIFSSGLFSKNIGTFLIIRPHCVFIASSRSMFYSTIDIKVCRYGISIFNQSSHSCQGLKFLNSLAVFGSVTSSVSEVGGLIGVGVGGVGESGEAAIIESSIIFSIKHDGFSYAPSLILLFVISDFINFRFLSYYFLTSNHIDTMRQAVQGLSYHLSTQIINALIRCIG